jgi:hypothetical protein
MGAMRSRMKRCTRWTYSAHLGLRAKSMGQQPTTAPCMKELNIRKIAS